MNRPWSERETDKLRRLYPQSKRSELQEAFPARTWQAIRCRAVSLKIKKLNTRRWTGDEVELLRRLYPDTRTEIIAKRLNRHLGTVYHKAREIGIKKSQEFLAGPDACRLRRGDNPGIATRFPKGNVPWNKGKRMWLRGCPESIKRGQFKKGQRGNRWVPIGTERVTDDGYIERKIKEGPGVRNWRAVHLILWEEKHGPLPAGHAIAFKDGNKQNVAYQNLECVTRKELMLRNSIHTVLPPDLRAAVVMLGALKRKVREGEREDNVREEQNVRSSE